MKKLLYFVLILIILGLGYLRWQGSQQSVPALVSSSPTPIPTQVLSDTLILSTDYFSLSYPMVATQSLISESPDSTTWSVSYMGPEQLSSGRTQTELFDGYSIGITRFEVVGEDAVANQVEVDRAGIIDACGEESVDLPKAGQLGQYDTLTYYGGCLGEATYHYLLIKDSLFRISSMVVGSSDDLVDYSSTVNQIFKSLVFVE